jgi:hypothetical protein
MTIASSSGASSRSSITSLHGTISPKNQSIQNSQSSGVVVATAYGAHCNNWSFGSSDRWTTVTSVMTIALVLGADDNRSGAQCCISVERNSCDESIRMMLLALPAANTLTLQKTL